MQNFRLQSRLWPQRRQRRRCFLHGYNREDKLHAKKNMFKELLSRAKHCAGNSINALCNLMSNTVHLCLFSLTSSLTIFTCVTHTPLYKHKEILLYSLCNFIFLLRYISGANNLLFTPLHLSDSFIYYVQ